MAASGTSGTPRSADATHLKRQKTCCFAQSLKSSGCWSQSFSTRAKTTGDFRASAS